MKINKLFVLILSAFPVLINCQNVDNPISLLLSKKGNEVVVQNDVLSTIKNITIDVSRLTLKVDEEKQLLALVTFKDGNTASDNKNITWTSDNSDIASITPEGVLKGISDGETGITVKYLEDGKVFRILVKVTKDTVIITPSAKPITSPTPRSSVIINIPSTSSPSSLIDIPSSTPTISQSSSQNSSISPTPEATPTPTPIEEVTPTPTPSPTPTDTPIPEVTPTPTPTPIPTDIPVI